MALTKQQIAQLEHQSCRSTDWNTVFLDAACDLSRMRDVEFVGRVSVGKNSGHVDVDGMRRPCGLYGVTLIDTSVGDDVRIANVRAALSRYDIETGAVIEDVGSLCADDGAAFGIGTEVETVNEAGGRVVVLYPSMSAQTAFLQAFRLHDESMQKGLSALIAGTVKASTPERGTVGRQATVLHCGTLRNVLIGDHARVTGTALLEEATILSCAEHPTVVGSAVQARHVIIAEGATVDGGAMLDKVYVGQATKIGKQFSAENALFFANCEGFHGEAVAIFAGPYTVTHHKSTLLIAAQFSFYNAGSGTNQSNHMYKLGPVHQGIFERGSKTGSFSYVLHETHVGAFSVVIGKHYTNINAADLPFSNIHETDGQSYIVPGLNLFSVGTVRDGEKWPRRDGRKAPVRRDEIIFDVFSPFTVEKIRRGRNMLRTLQETTPREQTTVKVGGMMMKRVFLRKSAKFYQQALNRYVLGSVLRGLHTGLTEGKNWKEATRALAAGKKLRDPLRWVDVAGLLLPHEMLTAVEAKIGNGTYRSMDDLLNALAEAAAAYRGSEQEYISEVFRQEAGFPPESLSPAQAVEILEEYEDAALGMQTMTFDDSRKEYDVAARIGYGIGMDDADVAKDFEAVRGTVDKNSVVSKLKKERADLEAWITAMREMLTAAA